MYPVIKKKQKVIIWATLAIIIGMLLFPPWHIKKGRKLMKPRERILKRPTAPRPQPLRPLAKKLSPIIILTKHGFIFMPPSRATKIDVDRLLIQMFIVVLFSIGIMLPDFNRVRYRKNKSKHKTSPIDKEIHKIEFEMSRLYSQYKDNPTVELEKQLDILSSHKKDFIKGHLIFWARFTEYKSGLKNDDDILPYREKHLGVSEFKSASEDEIIRYTDSIKSNMKNSKKHKTSPIDMEIAELKKRQLKLESMLKILKNNQSINKTLGEIEDRLQQLKESKSHETKLSIVASMKKYITFSNILRLIVTTMLFWALDKHPYDYFVLLRLITFGSCCYLIWLAYQDYKVTWIVIFAFIALLFNPLIPVHLKRETWAIIDCIVGGIYLTSIFFVRDKN